MTIKGEGRRQYCSSNCSGSGDKMFILMSRIFGFHDHTIKLVLTASDC